MLPNLSPLLLACSTILACQVGRVQSHTDTQIYNNASFLFNASIVPEVIDARKAGKIRKPRNWNDCVRKGVKSYREWQQATGDKPPPENENMGDAFATMDKPTVVLGGATVQILKTLRKSTDTNFYRDWDTFWPKDGCPPGGLTPPEFKNTLSVKQGVFIAFYNYRNDLPREWSFARVAFWSWQKAVKQEQALDKSASVGLSDLEYFIRSWISNTRTRAMIKYALSQVHAKPGDDTTFDFKEPPPEAKGTTLEEEELPDREQQPFWALIATPNGRAIIQLLIEHKESMQGKRLESVTVRWHQSGEGKDLVNLYAMWGKYGKSS